MEVAEAQLAGLVASQQLVQRLWATPDGRAHLLKAAGESGLSPEAQIAQDKAAEVQAMVDARIKPFEEREAARAKQADEDAKASVERQVREREAEARKVFGLTDKGIEAVRAFAAQRGISDIRDAAELMVARAAPELGKPSAEPLRVTETPEQKERAALRSRDPLVWARTEMAEGIDAIRRAAERNSL